MTYKNFFAATLLVASMASVASAQLTFPVTENFDGTGLSMIDYNGAYDNIETFAGTPSGDDSVINVNDGSYHQTVFFADDDGSLIDYRVTADIYVPANTALWSRVGLQVCCETNDNYTVDGVYFVVDTDGDDYMRVNTRTGGTFADGGQLPTTYTRDAWHEMKVEVIGESVTAYFDDVEVFTDATIGSTYTKNYVGIYNYIAGTSGDGSPTLVDKIVIEDLYVPPLSVDGWSLYD